MADREPQIGYLIKAAQSALHARLEDDLRPLGITVSHYACLRLLSDRPGISAAELARAAFVTRQSMNALLHTLRSRGLVDREDRARTGRALAATLSPAGAALLRRADVIADAVESRMMGGLSSAARRDLGRALESCISGLAAGTPSA